MELTLENITNYLTNRGVFTSNELEKQGAVFFTKVISHNIKNELEYFNRVENTNINPDDYISILTITGTNPKLIDALVSVDMDKYIKTHPTQFAATAAIASFYDISGTNRDNYFKNLSMYFPEFIEALINKTDCTYEQLVMLLGDPAVIKYTILKDRCDEVQAACRNIIHYYFGDEHEMMRWLRYGDHYTEQECKETRETLRENYFYYVGLLRELKPQYEIYKSFTGKQQRLENKHS